MQTQYHCFLLKPRNTLWSATVCQYSFTDGFISVFVTKIAGKFDTTLLTLWTYSNILSLFDRITFLSEQVKELFVRHGLSDNFIHIILDDSSPCRTTFLICFPFSIMFCLTSFGVFNNRQSKLFAYTI